jgi:hypothetical protein
MHVRERGRNRTSAVSLTRYSAQCSSSLQEPEKTLQRRRGVIYSILRSSRDATGQRARNDERTASTNHRAYRRGVPTQRLEPVRALPTDGGRQHQSGQEPWSNLDRCGQPPLLPRRTAARAIRRRQGCRRRLICSPPIARPGHRESDDTGHRHQTPRAATRLAWRSALRRSNTKPPHPLRRGGLWIVIHRRRQLHVWRSYFRSQGIFREGSAMMRNTFGEAQALARVR